MATRLWQALYIGWALIVGASVTFQLCTTVVLNRRSTSPTLHAFYVANLGVLLGGLLLVPHAAASRAPCKRPAKWWSLLGGLWSLPSFIGVPAGAVMGIQLVLLFQLFAMLSTALVFDFRRGDVRMSDYKRLGGFCVVLVGVVADNLAATSSGVEFTAATCALLAGTFASGVGYALQAKCNGRLARDLGTTTRAIAVSAGVNILAGLPMDVAMWQEFDVKFVFQWSDWPLWLFGGAQNAFYIGSLALLPKKLGYTTSYLTLLLGKLVSSSIVDSLGITGKAVQFDWMRGMAILLVLVGTAFFSGASIPCVARTSSDDEHVAQSVVSFHPSFTAPEQEPGGGEGARDLLGVAAGSCSAGVLPGSGGSQKQGTPAPRQDHLAPPPVARASAEAA